MLRSLADTPKGDNAPGSESLGSQIAGAGETRRRRDGIGKPEPVSLERTVGDWKTPAARMDCLRVAGGVGFSIALAVVRSDLWHRQGASVTFRSQSRSRLWPGRWAVSAVPGHGLTGMVGVRQFPAPSFACHRRQKKGASQVGSSRGTKLGVHQANAGSTA